MWKERKGGAIRPFLFSGITVLGSPIQNNLAFLDFRTSFAVGKTVRPDPLELRQGRKAATVEG